MEPVVETLDAVPGLLPVFATSVLGGKRTGDVLPARTLRLAGHRVEREQLRRYEEVCGYKNAEALPHTYPHVVGFPLQMTLMARRDFPLPLAGLVHVENVITAHRAIDFTEVLDISVTADALRPHPKGRVVDLVTEVDVAGERVWKGRSTYLARGRGEQEAERGDAPPAMPVGPRGPAAAVWRLPGDLGRTYGLVSGDVNPIHLSGLTAKAMGFQRAIAHGMWTYARTLAALGPRAEGAATSHVWFKKPVLLPGSVELVVGRSADQVVAGLRSARTRTTEHVVLTLDAPFA